MYCFYFGLTYSFVGKGGGFSIDIFFIINIHFLCMCTFINNCDNHNAKVIES